MFLTIVDESIIAILTSGACRLAPPAKKLCRVRLLVRTPGFHPGKRGSTPLRDAKFSAKVCF